MNQRKLTSMTSFVAPRVSPVMPPNARSTAHRGQPAHHAADQQDRQGGSEAKDHTISTGDNDRRAEDVPTRQVRRRWGGQPPSVAHRTPYAPTTMAQRPIAGDREEPEISAVQAVTTSAL